MSRFPHHAALELLAEQKQFDACRMVAEKMIADQMAPPSVDQGLPAEAMLQRWQDRDLELAHLHLILSRCLFGLHEYQAAATNADMARLLARTAGEFSLYAEACHLAGACQGQAGNLNTAAERFTDCLQHATGLLRAKALYNRGHVYERQGAYGYAVPDYEEALQLAGGLDRRLERSAMTNLAWDLIMLKQFERAEELLERLETAPDAQADAVLRAQIAHDKLHIAHLQGQHRQAFQQIVQALRRTDQAFPHVRARVALTTMSLAADLGLHEEACVVGLVAKRLASQAQRPDLDDEASRLLHDLEAEAGTDCVVQSLQRARQLLPGVIKTGRGKKSGGVA